MRLTTSTNIEDILWHTISNRIKIQKDYIYEDSIRIMLKFLSIVRGKLFKKYGYTLRRNRMVACLP